jgi:hypothetical protein
MTLCVRKPPLPHGWRYWCVQPPDVGAKGCQQLKNLIWVCMHFQQVQHKVEAKQAAASVQPSRASAAAAAAAPELGRRLQELLVHKTASEETRVAATAQRQQLLQKTVRFCTPCRGCLAVDWIHQQSTTTCMPGHSVPTADAVILLPCRHIRQ